MEAIRLIRLCGRHVADQPALFRDGGKQENLHLPLSLTEQPFFKLFIFV